MKATCLRKREINLESPETEERLPIPALESYHKERHQNAKACFKIAALAVVVIFVTAFVSNQDAGKTRTGNDESILLAATNREPHTSHHAAGKKPTAVSRRKSSSKTVSHVKFVPNGNSHRKVVRWTPSLNEDFPDTSVIHVDGVYYAYSTQVYLDNVPFRTSIDGIHWSAEPGNAMPKLPSWASFGYTWAPTVTTVGHNHYLMFFVARDGASGSQCIGRAESSSPAGPFIDTSASPVICDPSAGGDIDPHIFSDPRTGQLYLIWKLNANAVGETTSLWVSLLDSGFNLVGAPHELLTADQAWQGGNIERPDMIEEGGVYDLFYAGNDYYSASYGIGFATCASPLGPCFDSSNSPVLTSGGGMSGPGGPSLFSGPDGLEFAFSAWAGKVGYGNGGYRAFYIASVTFLSGVPHLGPVTSAASDLT